MLATNLMPASRELAIGKQPLLDLVAWAGIIEVSLRWDAAGC
jgi:hypothetical protein